MTVARLARVVRYPVKGFGGQDLTAVAVRPGAGLPHDRAVAITNGSLPAAQGEWTGCKAFIRLNRNSELPRYRMSLDADTVALTAPDGERVSMRLGDHDDYARVATTLARWFPSMSADPTRLISADQGMWDQQDAVLSLINLETVAEMGRVAGRAIGPLRFRGNLYLADLPAWDELRLIGRRLRIGDVEVEVLRPIERCRATSVDPTEAVRDINMPALLTSTNGHLYCGLYARVVVPGELRTDARVTDIGSANLTAADLKVPSAPRVVQVARKVRESATATTVWFRDTLAHVRPAPVAGQHIRLHARDADGAFWRSYTVSGVEDGHIRITVKRVGRMSTHLHDQTDVGDDIILTGPFGDPSVEEDVSTPLLLGSAGIGITPTVATLRELVATGSTQPVRVVHVARDSNDLALWSEVRDLAATLPDATTELYLTRAGAGEWRSGRPGKDDWSRSVTPDTSALLCGPLPFLHEVRDHLLSLGTHPDRVRSEIFASPGTDAGATVAAPYPGPFTVRFAKSGTETTWSEDDGTILDLADGEGLLLPANCRAGACGKCAQRLVDGSTAYTTKPVLPPNEPTVLLCCAVPASDVVLDA